MTDSTLLQPYLEKLAPWLYVESTWWTGVGILGTSLFSSRFVMQWLTSEKHGRIVVPSAFWHLSFWGSCVNFLYCLHLDKLPLILGNFFLPLIYARSLWLHYRPKQPVAKD